MSGPGTLDVLLLGLNYAPEPSGIAPYTTGLAEGLSRKGHRVRVLTSFPHYPHWSYQGDVARTTVQDRNGVRVERHRHYVPQNPRSVNRALFELAYGMRVAGRRWGTPDVILSVSPALLSSALFFARARAQPSSPALGLIIQDIYSSGLGETGARGGPLSRLMMAVEARTARAADGVAVIHERFASQVVERLHVSRDRIDVIRNWTHVPAVTNLDRRAFRRSMRWPDSEIIVLHAGAMGVKQGLENVVDAAALADAQHQPVRFVLLGDGGQRTALEARAAGVQRVEFLDHLDDDSFTRALASADVLLVNERPGVREMAVPSKLTTYFNAAKPVLAATESDSTTTHEVLAASAGICVPPGRPAALVAGALLIAADEEAAVKMGERGRRYATDILSQERAIDSYESWIRKLVARRQGSLNPQG